MDTHPAIHPTSEILQAYGLGDLDDASAEAVNKHLEDCPDCRPRSPRCTRQFPRTASTSPGRTGGNGFIDSRPRAIGGKFGCG